MSKTNKSKSVIEDVYKQLELPFPEPKEPTNKEIAEKKKTIYALTPPFYRRPVSA